MLTGLRIRIFTWNPAKTPDMLAKCTHEVIPQLVISVRNPQNKTRGKVGILCEHHDLSYTEGKKKTAIFRGLFDRHFLYAISKFSM